METSSILWKNDFSCSVARNTFFVVDPASLPFVRFFFTVFFRLGTAPFFPLPAGCLISRFFTSHTAPWQRLLSWLDQPRQDLTLRATFFQPVVLESLRFIFRPRLNFLKFLFFFFCPWCFCLTEPVVGTPFISPDTLLLAILEPTRLLLSPPHLGASFTKERFQRDFLFPKIYVLCYSASMPTFSQFLLWVFPSIWIVPPRISRQLL